MHDNIYIETESITQFKKNIFFCYCENMIVYRTYILLIVLVKPDLDL